MYTKNKLKRRITDFLGNTEFRKKAQRIGGILGAFLLLFQIIQAIRSYQSMQIRFVHPGLILIALGLLFLATLQQMASWALLMRGLGVVIPWKALPRGYILSFLPRYIPGTVWGYLSRGEWLRQDYQIPYAISNIGSLIEIFIAVFSNVVVMVLYLAATAHGTNRLYILVAFGALVFLMWWFIRKMVASPRVMAASTGHPPTFPFPLWAVCLLLVTINMFAYGAALYATILSLNIVATPLPFLQNWLPLTFTFTIAWLIGFLIFIFPSGLGLREVTLAGLLVINFSLGYESASAVSVLFRLWVTVAELIWILLVGWSWIGKKLAKRAT